jgi:hypothetical protein
MVVSLSAYLLYAQKDFQANAGGQNHFLGLAILSSVPPASQSGV